MNVDPTILGFGIGADIFDPSVFKQYLLYGPMIDAAKITIELAVLSQVVGIVLGLFAALGRLSRMKLPIFRWMSAVYLWLFRGTPLLVQIAFVYFALPQLTAHRVILNEFNSAFVALAVNEGAYMAEIIRAGITSVEAGQLEAAESVGMTRWMAMRRVVLPQAIRVIIPPTGNEFISMLKNTSLASVISAHELFFEESQISSAIFRNFEPLAVISVWYLAMTTVATYFQGHLERHFARGFAREKHEPGLMQRVMVRAHFATLRALSLGTILKESFVLYARNSLLLVGLASLLALPELALAAGALWVGLPQIIIPIAFFYTLLILGCMTLAASTRYLGWNIGISDSYLPAGSATFFTLLGAEIAVTALVLVGTVLLLVPGVYLLVRFLFVPHAVVLEERDLRDAFSRSGELVQGCWWRVFGAFLTITVPLALVTALVLKNVPLPLGDIIGYFVVPAIVLPLVFTALTLLYYDVRVRKEGPNLGEAPTESARAA